MADDVFDNLGKLRVLPLVTLQDAGRAEALGETLKASGLPCVEITFRSAAAAAAIRAAAKVPGLLIGAGTVITVDQAKQALDAGATFLVSPGIHPRVVSFCVERKIPVLPGVCTPTDIAAALDFGLSVLKFFPAEAFGGPKTLQALSAPYSMIRFVPTGGIDARNLPDYLKLPKVLACGGSWMVKQDWVDNGKFDEIAKTVKEALAIAQAASPKATK